MSFVNPVEITQGTIRQITESDHRIGERTPLAQVDDSASLTTDLLTSDELARMRSDLETNPWIPVGTNGILADCREGDQVGSWRASVHSEQLANALWIRLQPALGIRTFDSTARTDWDGHPSWRPVGINPLLRMIRYRNAGLLVPHYDAPYIADADHRTLVTVVIYIACDADVQGGATRFIRDPQLALPFADRDHSDWPRLAREDEINASVEPTPGSALIFDHRLLHDSQPLTSTAGGCKMILRTDVIYERA